MINNNNRDDDIKKEDGKVDNADNSYIGDEYKNLFNKSRLMDGDLRLTEFNNKKLGLKNIVNNYLEKIYPCR